MLFEVQEDQRDLVGPDRAELGDRHLVLRQHLEQQRLGLELDPVDLVDQQHDGVGRPDGLEQRAGQEELLGEDVLFEVPPRGAGAVALPSSPAWIRSSCLL